MSVVTEEAELEVAQTERLSERIARSYGWFILAVATTLAYLNTFAVPFVFDGTNYIVDNADLRDLREPAKILGFSPTRAVGYFSFALNYQLAKALSAGDDGYDPRSWHAVSLGIHTMAAWVLWGLARRGLNSARFRGRYQGSSERLALTIALIWAVHPLCTQAVTYLYQRVESLMGLFLLLTIYCMVRFAACQERQAQWRLASRQAAGRSESDGDDDSEDYHAPLFSFGLFLWPALAVVFCLAGMATKETMVVAPFLALWYDRVFVARSWYGLIARRGFQYLALFVTWSLLWQLMRMTPYDAAGLNDHRHDTRLTYFLNETRVILHYFKLAYYPDGQNLDYSWKRAVVKPDDFRPEGVREDQNEEQRRELRKEQRQYLVDTFLATKYSLAALMALGLATLWAVYFRPPPGFLAGAVFVALAPTSSFVVIIDLAFEQRMYVPLMALVPLTVMLVYETLGFIGRRLEIDLDTIATVRISLGWLTVAVLIALTLRRNYDYRSHIAIWADAEKKAPHNARAAYNHGVFLQNDTTAGSLDQALEQYQKTLELQPNYDGAHLNLANVYAWKATWEPDLERRDELLVDAERHYYELLRILPGDERGLYGIADVLRQRKRWNEAEEYVDQLLSINPNHEQGQKLKADIARMRAGVQATPTGTG